MAPLFVEEFELLLSSQVELLEEVSWRLEEQLESGLKGEEVVGKEMVVVEGIVLWEEMALQQVVLLLSAHHTQVLPFVVDEKLLVGLEEEVSWLEEEQLEQKSKMEKVVVEVAFLWLEALEFQVFEAVAGIGQVFAVGEEMVDLMAHILHLGSHHLFVVGSLLKQTITIGIEAEICVNRKQLTEIS